MLISIPPYGLGDVLYHSLALKIIESTAQQKVCLYNLPNCAEIANKIDIPFVPHYPKILHHKMPFSWCNEKMFWTSLSKNKHATFYTISNDIIDKLIAARYGLKFVDNKMGNYFLLHATGLRGKLNTTFHTLCSKNISYNSKHVVERHAYLTNKLCNTTTQDFLTASQQLFQQSFNIPPKNKESIVFIFPEARHTERNLSDSFIKKIIASFKKDYRIIIYANAKKFDTYATKNIAIKKFANITQTIQDAATASLIIAPDSFPAHFSGLLGTKTFVIYNRPKFDKYCEFWGSPYNNVFHLQDDSIYTLDEHFKAQPLAKKDEEATIIFHQFKESHL